MSIFNCTPIVPEILTPVNILTGTGEILSDKKKNGKERPWNRYKKISKILAEIFGEAIKRDPTCISEAAYIALQRCCAWLLFRKYKIGRAHV